MLLPLEGREHTLYALSICGIGQTAREDKRIIQIRISNISEVMQHGLFRIRLKATYLNRADDGLHMNIVITVRIVIPEYLLRSRLPA